jgi:uncharacterized integral membrane protein (TIGR00698 family)
LTESDKPLRSEVDAVESALEAPPPRISEDYLAVWIGGAVLVAALVGLWLFQGIDFADRVGQFEQQKAELRQLERNVETSSASQLELTAARQNYEAAQKKLVANPLKGLFTKLGSWASNPLDAFQADGKSIFPGVLGVLAACIVLLGAGVAVQGVSLRRFLPAFAVVFLLALLAFLFAGQKTIKHFNFEYAIWALAIGLAISNTIGTPAWLRPGLRTEFYIKTGLVLYGAEILLQQLLALGVPGIFVSWVVTPITLVGTYLFGQYVLRIPSKSLNLVISADMSVCGVSAAIATAAACRAKKEELSLAIGISLTFTAIMMVIMPQVVQALGLSPVVGGAWLGGTIDSTGAVVAAGAAVGRDAEVVAFTVKMIQNILIGVVAFAVAIYWVSWVEPSDTGVRPSPIEIWRRFPKFVLGFLGGSVLFTLVSTQAAGGEALAQGVIKSVSDPLRTWLFCLAFVSIGLETDFRSLGKYFRGGKPLVLYACGQSFNLAFTLLMAWLMFEKVFPRAAEALSQ